MSPFSEQKEMISIWIIVFESRMQNDTENEIDRSPLGSGDGSLYQFWGFSKEREKVSGNIEPPWFINQWVCENLKSYQRYHNYL